MSKSLALRAEPVSFKLHHLTKRAQFPLDLTILFSAFVFSYLLRFDFDIPAKDFLRMTRQLPWVVILQFSVLILCGIYKFIWRYIGLREVKRFVCAALFATIPLLVFRFMLPEDLVNWRVPISIILIDAFLAFGSILGLRVIRRDYYERKKLRQTVRKNVQRRPVLLIGAGRAGVLTVTEIRNRGDMDIEVKGFIDDDKDKKGSIINGVRVLGTTQDLAYWVQKLKIDHVVISIAQVSRQQYKKILDTCEQVPVKVKTIPALYEILQGRVKVTRIREVQIEDLLGRDPVHLDEECLNSLLRGKTVMVTGAGGSIGSELARQILRFNPACVYLVERSEFALFNIDRELREFSPHTRIIPLLADICDRLRMEHVFLTGRPQVVLHAAAHKHVPMMELNAGEATKNNVLGTRLVGTLAGEYGAEVFVLISSDKAVRPASVMGATKRMAELVIQDLNGKYATRFVAVRFGNVIGSAGSVIPIFREQICKGGPVTVTHPDMMRYFMTIPEASQLVLQAGGLGQGGEIFILDMGQPVRIFDLAKETIRLSGLRPFEDIDIVFTGIRQGEKLFEELHLSSEEATMTIHPKIFIGKIAEYSSEQLAEILDSLTVFAKRGMEAELRRTLNSFLTEANLNVETDAEEVSPVVLTQENNSLLSATFLHPTAQSVGS